MKAKKRTGKARTSGKRAQKDLTARRASRVTGGTSDLIAKFQQQIGEANNILVPPPPPPPPPPRPIRLR